MNCHTARELLSAGTDASWFEHEQREQALAHVRSCPVCQRASQRVTQWDDELRSAFQDVAIPHGLRDRLLSSLFPATDDDMAVQSDAMSPIEHSSASSRRESASLASEESLDARAVGPVTNDAEADRAPAVTCPLPMVDQQIAVSAPPARGATLGRRTALRRMAIAAASLLVGGVGWEAWRATREPSLALEAVVEAATRPVETERAAFQAFDGQTPLSEPRTLDWPRGARRSSPRQLTISGHLAAVYEFSLPHPGRGKLAGRLVVLPRRWLLVPPATSRFLQAPATYFGAYCTNAWAEGDLVFVCCLEGSESDLHRLLPRRTAS